MSSSSRFWSSVQKRSSPSLMTSLASFLVAVFNHGTKIRLKPFLFFFLIEDPKVYSLVLVARSQGHLLFSLLMLQIVYISIYIYVNIQMSSLELSIPWILYT